MRSHTNLAVKHGTGRTQPHRQRRKEHKRGADDQAHHRNHHIDGVLMHQRTVDPDGVAGIDQLGRAQFANRHAPRNPLIRNRGFFHDVAAETEIE
jgi:hypothetical protein